MPGPTSQAMREMLTMFDSLGLVVLDPSADGGVRLPSGAGRKGLVYIQSGKRSGKSVSKAGEYPAQPQHNVQSREQLNQEIMELKAKLAARSTIPTTTENFSEMSSSLNDFQLTSPKPVRPKVPCTPTKRRNSPTTREFSTSPTKRGRRAVEVSVLTVRLFDTGGVVVQDFNIGVDTVSDLVLTVDRTTSMIISGTKKGQAGATDSVPQIKGQKLTLGVLKEEMGVTRRGRELFVVSDDQGIKTHSEIKFESEFAAALKGHRSNEDGNICIAMV
ncbi:hypothetical protein Vi05172_g10850 [Venturia inaequalis]|nr:hypothetical protein Vi05172_g10850 [Venturia inaequalis]